MRQRQEGRKEHTLGPRREQARARDGRNGRKRREGRRSRRTRERRRLLRKIQRRGWKTPRKWEGEMRDQIRQGGKRGTRDPVEEQARGCRKRREKFNLSPEIKYLKN